jgi:rod shape-determining protein MreB
VITGEGSMLLGLATRFQEEINLPIITVDNPLTSVMLAVGKIFDKIELSKKGFSSFV